jgi:ABC-type multidrug transport system fused ATPase/permease subunit
MWDKFKNALPSGYARAFFMTDVWSKLNWRQKLLIPASILIDLTASACSFASLLALTNSVEVIANPDHNADYSVFGYMDINALHVQNRPADLLYTYASLYLLANDILPRLKKILLVRMQSDFPQKLGHDLHEKMLNLDTREYEEPDNIKSAIRKINTKCSMLLTTNLETVYPSLANGIFSTYVAANLGRYSTLNNGPILATFLGYLVVDVITNLLPQVLILDRREYKEEELDQLYVNNTTDIITMNTLIRSHQRADLEVLNANNDLDKYYSVKRKNIYKSVLLQFLGGLPDSISKFILIVVMSYEHEFKKNDISEIIFLFRYTDLLHAFILQFVKGLRETRLVVNHIDEVKSIIAKQALREVLVDVGIMPNIAPDSSPTHSLLRHGFIRLKPDFSNSLYIEFKNVTFSYNLQQGNVLNHLSFIIEPGQTVSFVGLSSSGKSTVLKLIVGFYAPQQGEIFINGFNIQNFTEEELSEFRRMIGFMPQNVQIFENDSLKYNILYCDPLYAISDLYKIKLANKEVRKALKDAPRDEVLAQTTYTEATQHLSATPIAPECLAVLNEDLQNKNKDHQPIGVLSGGQKQMVGFARLLAHLTSKLRLLDEPTASLDPESEEKMLEHLNKLIHKSRRMKTTTVIVTHRLPIAKYSDSIVVIDKGRKIEEGPHDVLLSKQGTYASFWKKQAAPYLDSSEKKSENQNFKLKT